MQNNIYTSIFLKEIEFYTGIIFMTSNRLDSIDDAFKSRISMNVEYTKLDTKSKEFICDSIMNKLGITDKNIKQKIYIMAP